MDTPSRRCLTDLERVWLAAIIDGEGCIMICRAKRPDGGWRFTPKVTFTNTSKCLMDRFAELTSDWLTRVRYRPENGGDVDKNKAVWTAEITYRKTPAFIAAILPYLIAKREQANLLLEFMVAWDEVERISKQHLPRFNEFYIRSRLLNRRGTKALDVEQLRQDIKP